MDNKIGIYYAYWEQNWDVDLIPYVSKVANLGFDILEVNSDVVVSMNPKARRKLKNEADKYGIELTYCVGLTKEYDISSNDVKIREKGIKYLKNTIKAIKKMGGSILGGIIYGVWGYEQIANKEKRLNNSIESMKEVIKVAEKEDVFCNIEVVNRFEQPLINTHQEAINYVEKVDSKNLKIMLDTFHMNIEEDSFKKAILNTGELLGHFHIGENNRKPPGRGRLPWQNILNSLNKINYTGHIIMEPFIQQGGEIGSDIKLFRDLKEDTDLDMAAQKALKFIKGKLNSC